MEFKNYVKCTDTIQNYADISLFQICSTYMEILNETHCVLNFTVKLKEQKEDCPGKQQFQENVHHLMKQADKICDGQTNGWRQTHK